MVPIELGNRIEAAAGADLVGSGGGRGRGGDRERIGGRGPWGEGRKPSRANGWWSNGVGNFFLGFLKARDLPGDSCGAVKLVKVGCTPLERTLGPRGLCVGFLFFLFLFLPSPKSKSCDYEICDAPSTLPASYNVIKEW